MRLYIPVSVVDQIEREAREAREAAYREERDAARRVERAKAANKRARAESRSLLAVRDLSRDGTEMLGRDSLPPDHFSRAPKPAWSDDDEGWGEELD